nr:uncharacterized protein LOC129261553 isoform X1 [Lytechinus pictus]
MKLMVLRLVDSRMYRPQQQELLITAVEQGNKAEVETCLNMPGTDINEKPWGMESLLMRAIRCNHKDVAELLMERGIDVEPDSPRSETKDCRQKSARDYAEFYGMPDIVKKIDEQRIKRMARP